MMIEPMPHADEADIAEQARPGENAIDEYDAIPDKPGENQDGDVGGLLDQKLLVFGHDEDHPPAAGRAAAALVTSSVDRPTWESNSLTTQRSFIDDMASQNQAYRPGW
jgi:hypothetical protein